MSTPLPTTQPPQAQDYAGDEINALVLDPGFSTTRAGFAGEDVPKSVVPTHYGVTGSGEYLFGESALHQPRSDGTEIRNPIGEDGLVSDWDTATKLWEFTIVSRLTGAGVQHGNKKRKVSTRDEEGDEEMKDGTENGAKSEEETENNERPLEEYPLLISEPSWNPTKAREQLMEISMEEWGVPAFFLARNGQLAAYSQGKATALVVDVGAQQTSVTALWEGMVLKKTLTGFDEMASDQASVLMNPLLHQSPPDDGSHSSLTNLASGIQKSPLGGNWLNRQIRTMFQQQQPPVPLTPHYMIKSKTPVDAGTPSSATYVHFDRAPTDSFRALQEDRVLTSFKESVVQCWSGPGRLDGPSTTGVTNYEYAKSLPARPFEMPDGWNQIFGAERFKVVEGMFDHNAAYSSASQPGPSSEQTLPNLLHKSLNACDVDARPHLLANIILTGAGSLIEKLQDRLQADMQAMYPNPKVRVIANTNSVERKYGAWIGGSVLASLGTFHQMWISKREYDEFGPGIVDKRCK